MLIGKLMLTATMYDILEDIHLALDLIAGFPIRIKHLELKKDLRKGHGVFYCEGQEHSLQFTVGSRGHIRLMLWIDEARCFHAGINPNDKKMWVRAAAGLCEWSGASILDRKAKPRFPYILEEYDLRNRLSLS